MVGWDTARDGWRTFRADRIALRVPEGPRFTPRAAPPADLVPRGVDAALARHRARVTVRAPAAEITARVPASVLVEPLDADTCAVHASGDTPERLALNILMLDADFRADGPPELLDALRAIAGRCRAAAAGRG
ncbi:helix-turn-helix transcriptional regulator [Actinomadura sp.]|uniref:helix-turn-helix transcriptional regulator n=1 Tax=Actinomadura sp. TaxID=1989 RepID=UPI0037C86547